MSASKRVPLFACQECGRKFYTVKAAERASDAGCPGCGGCDVDLYVPPAAADRKRSSLEVTSYAETGGDHVVVHPCGWQGCVTEDRLVTLATSGCPSCGLPFEVTP